MLGRMPSQMSGVIALAIAMIALAITATCATAATTRAEYVAQVDPICANANAQSQAANRKFSRWVKHFLKQHPNLNDRPTKASRRVVSRFYRHLVGIGRTENNQIAVVTPAPGDEAIVARWLQLRVASIDSLDRATRSIAHSKFKPAFKFLSRYFALEFQAQDVVADFGFRECVYTDDG